MHTMGVVIFSQWRRSMRDTYSCACAHQQLSVSTVAARVRARSKLACTRYLLSETVTLMHVLFAIALSFKHDVGQSVSSASFTCQAECPPLTVRYGVAFLSDKTYVGKS